MSSASHANEQEARVRFHYLQGVRARLTPGCSEPADAASSGPGCRQGSPTRCQESGYSCAALQYLPGASLIRTTEGLFDQTSPPTEPLFVLPGSDLKKDQPSGIVRFVNVHKTWSLKAHEAFEQVWTSDLAYPVTPFSQGVLLRLSFEIVVLRPGLGHEPRGWWCFDSRGQANWARRGMSKVRLPFLFGKRS